MSDSTLSYISTDYFRNRLITKNLKPYKVDGVFSPNTSNTSYETQLSDYNVIDSPDRLIKNPPYLTDLYVLNRYGTQGGNYTNTTYNGAPYPVIPNQGEYDPSETKLDAINEYSIDVIQVENKYLPEGGYLDMVTIDNLQNNDKIYLPYWAPSSFNPSSYRPYEILMSQNPTGSNGSLSQDSYLAKLGAQNLKKALEERLSAQAKMLQNATNFDSLSDSFSLTQIAAGQQLANQKNWRITLPENPLLTTQEFLARLAGVYTTASPIPGDYFIENENNSIPTQQKSNALNVINRLTGGFLGPILNTIRNPSQIFLANTGNGQRSALFVNLNLNRYQPAYDKNYGGILSSERLVSLAESLINPNNGTVAGEYYVGSKNNDPFYITSPPNQIPVNSQGKQVLAPVYGPSELANLYEGNLDVLKFGLAGKTLNDGGGIEGNFVWVSPKRAGAAGYKATPGGNIGSIDSDYNLISSTYEKSESILVDFKDSSILDQTQRLIDSADNVTGINRLKHVGNAINQVSKVFNDGYKEITKGSRVVSYKDFTTGVEQGIEYCRVFAKDTPYYTFNDLQKVDGITTEGRRFTNSVLDNTFNLNIAPLKGPNSTNIKPNSKNVTVAKKYMFSIENLAWRTSSRPGFTYDELPDCEKGPNGGRVMWFPPYEIKFGDSSSASWTPTDFMGRPEPIYTYKSTTRSGTLSWKIIVDHPSVLNVIVEQQLKDVKDKVKINSILDSFFAGCTKFDIYKLGKQFNRLKPSTLYQIQEILNNPKLTPEELLLVTKNIEIDNTGGNTKDGQANVDTQKVNQDKQVADFKTNYKDYSFYFDNDIPKSGGDSYETDYNKYIGEKSLYEKIANEIFDSNLPNCKGSKENYCKRNKNVGQFFSTYVEGNYSYLTTDFVNDLYNILKDDLGTIVISMAGSASAAGNQTYNDGLSTRRIESVRNFYSNKTFNGNISLKTYFDNKKVIIKEDSQGNRQNATPVTKGNTKGDTVTCSQKVVAGNNGETRGNTYSTDSMACRRVSIVGIEFTPNPKKDVKPQTNTQNPEVPDRKTVTKQTIVPKKPEPQKSFQTTKKEGISKIVLRNLLTECDYFTMLEKNTPFIYDSIKEKIKYFNPAFHSMTPEGLNARLNFLNQCVRPGETIPVIDSNGNPKYNDALNTSFGAPPVLILRIGDFYHTKIIPETLSFSYEPLVFDMNPEGIGVQPMIVTVNMGFKMIGGHGLAKPVEQLQNALSFNYYANTEIYDERAVATEDTSTLDKEVLDAIENKETPATEQNIDNKPENNGGDTIGQILTTVNTADGTEGLISYKTIMDKLVDTTSNYYTNLINQMEKIVLTTNYGMLQLVNQKRLYDKGHLLINNNVKLGVEIWGKAEEVQKRIDELFKTAYTQIDNETNPLIFEFKKLSGVQIYLRDIKRNLTNYVKSIESEISNDIFTTLQEIVNQEQEFVQVIRKVGIINTKFDGKILDSGNPQIYTLSEEPVDGNDNYKTLIDDAYEFEKTMIEFNELIKTEDILTNFYNVPGNFKPVKTNFVGGYAGTTPEKVFFMIVSRKLSNSNNLTFFKSKIISGQLIEIKTPVDLQLEFSKITDKLISEYNKELDKEESKFSKFKDSSKYRKFTKDIEDKMFKKRKEKFRKLKYQSVKGSQTEPNFKIFKDLYSTVNPNTDNKTFDGKIKFD